MSRVFFITGVSSGIGLACTRFFLEKGDRVVGIGRRSETAQANYSFLKLDLSNLEAVSSFRFPEIGGHEFVLINNAGTLGDVAPVWNQTDTNFHDVMQVNVAAPAMLAKKFINQFQNGIIVNISSGAAQRPIKGWAAYCASKSALDMFSSTLQEELDHYNKPFIVKSIAPGVVDTHMQARIREASPKSFPDSSKFHDLHETDQLDNPADTAAKLNYVLEHLGEFNSVVLSLRDIQL